MKNKKWYKLDNAGKIFPPTTDHYDTKTFRFSVALKEGIDKEILTNALKDTLKDYPIFHSTLKKGIFWYYLEESDVKPFVTLEERIPCDYMYGLLYKVTYYKKRINLEVSHALTDATVTLAFLKALTENYLKLKHKLEQIRQHQKIDENGQKQYMNVKDKWDLQSR